jgi:hypothetical protein
MSSNGSAFRGREFQPIPPLFRRFFARVDVVVAQTVDVERQANGQYLLEQHQYYNYRLYQAKSKINLSPRYALSSGSVRKMGAKAELLNVHVAG